MTVQEQVTALEKLKAEVDKLNEFDTRFAEWSTELKKILNIIHGVKETLNIWVKWWPDDTAIYTTIIAGIEIEIARIKSNEKISYEDLLSKTREAIIANLYQIIAALIHDVKEYVETMKDNVSECLNEISPNEYD